MPSLWIKGADGEVALFPVREERVTLGDGRQCFAYYCGDRLVLAHAAMVIDLIEVLNGAPPGLVLEFGVAAGHSIRRLASSGRQIYGFDWWKGLPHEWNPADGRGSCYAPKPTDLPDNVTLVDGLFSDTLEDFLKVHRDPVGFVHIDCDLYAPSCFILHCLMDRFVVGSVIAFDEIIQGHYGELQAWQRYLQISRQQWEFVGNQHAWGEVYRCTKL